MSSFRPPLKIVLLANDWVGLQIAKHFKKQSENVVVLVLRSGKKAKYAPEIKKEINTKKVCAVSDTVEDKAIKEIRRLKPDIAVCAWFGSTLPDSFLSSFSMGVINMHHSYLPYGRGMHPHVWAIYENQPYGVTIQYMDKKIDNGDIISQKRLKIDPIDTAGSLYQKALEEMVDLFIKTWPQIKKGKNKRFPQKNKKPLRKREEIKKLNRISLQSSYTGKNLINLLRARSFKEHGYAYYKKGGEKIYVKISLSKKPHFDEN